MCDERASPHSPSEPENETLPHRMGAVVHHSKIAAPMSALGQKRTSRLLDHLIGRSEQRLWNGQSERLCGLEIENQFVLGRRLHWHIGWVLTLEDAIDIPGGLPDHIVRTRSVRDQAAVYGVIAIRINRRQF